MERRFVPSLSLANQEQPEGDIHEFNAELLETTREKAKKKFLHGFIIQTGETQNSEDNYKNEEVLNKYYENGLVETPFGRKIESDDFHSLNYLLQSTSSDNCLSQAIKISKFLRGRRSFVHSVVHDSITIDFHKDDRDIIHQVKQIFEDTRLGMFPSSMHIGKNYKDMEKV